MAEQNFTKGDKVAVVGPQGSNQRGKTGKVVSVSNNAATYPHHGTGVLSDYRKARGHTTPKTMGPDGVVVTVRLDGEDAPRNFRPADLARKG